LVQEAVPLVLEHSTALAQLVPHVDVEFRFVSQSFGFASQLAVLAEQVTQEPFEHACPLALHFTAMPQLPVASQVCTPLTSAAQRVLLGVHSP